MSPLPLLHLRIAHGGDYETDEELIESVGQKPSSNELSLHVPTARETRLVQEILESGK